MNEDLPPRASLKFARTDPADPDFRVRYLDSSDLWSAPRLTQVVDVRHARMVYLSGQAPADAGYKVASQDFRAQMHKVFDNIEVALAVGVPGRGRRGCSGTLSLSAGRKAVPVTAGDRSGGQHRTHGALLPWLLAGLAPIGPFAIDTYLPSFPSMARDFAVGELLVQQTLSAYMGSFAIMTLFHGALSDSFGRRPVILVNLLVFVAASIGCALAPTIEALLACRALQGMSAGAGIVVGRAIIRDTYDGPMAQRLMSQVTMLFSLAPAVAPVIGGVLDIAFGWRSIFVFLTFFSLLLWAGCAWTLPETLPKTDRQPFRAAPLVLPAPGVVGHRFRVAVRTGNRRGDDRRLAVRPTRRAGDPGAHGAARVRGDGDGRLPEHRLPPGVPTSGAVDRAAVDALCARDGARDAQHDAARPRPVSAQPWHGRIGTGIHPVDVQCASRRADLAAGCRYAVVSCRHCRYRDGAGRSLLAQLSAPDPSPCRLAGQSDPEIVTPA